MSLAGWGVGGLSGLGYIGNYGPKGYGFSAILVINRVSILAILVISRVWLLYSSLHLGVFFSRSNFFIIIRSISIGPFQRRPHPTALSRQGLLLEFSFLRAFSQRFQERPPLFAFNPLIPYLGKKNSVVLIGQLKNPSIVPMI